MKLYKRHSRLDIRRFNFTIRVVDCWNSLPQHVINAPSIYAFENRLDKFWNNLVCKYDFEAALASDRHYYALWNTN